LSFRSAFPNFRGISGGPAQTRDRTNGTFMSHHGTRQHLELISFSDLGGWRRDSRVRLWDIYVSSWRGRPAV
jgi:hypothetical protein